jgi:CBS domain-containing protein
MKIKDLMSQPVVTCPTQCTLDQAARLMWEFDCGIIPVVNDAGRLAGVVTDRDICMAAYTQGKPLREIAVETALATPVVAVFGNDSIDAAEELLRANQIHRLPVLDQDSRPIGLLSVNDLARAAARAGNSSVDRELVATVAAICQPRQSTPPRPPTLVPAVEHRA